MWLCYWLRWKSPQKAFGSRRELIVLVFSPAHLIFSIDVSAAFPFPFIIKAIVFPVEELPLKNAILEAYKLFSVTF